MLTVLSNLITQIQIKIPRSCIQRDDSCKLEIDYSSFHTSPYTWIPIGMYKTFSHLLGARQELNTMQWHVRKARAARSKKDEIHMVIKLGTYLLNLKINIAILEETRRYWQNFFLYRSRSVLPFGVVLGRFVWTVPIVSATSSNAGRTSLWLRSRAFRN